MNSFESDTISSDPSPSPQPSPKPIKKRKKRKIRETNEFVSVEIVASSQQAIKQKFKKEQELPFLPNIDDLVDSTISSKTPTHHKSKGYGHSSLKLSTKLWKSKLIKKQIKKKGVQLQSFVVTNNIDNEYNAEHSKKYKNWGEFKNIVPSNASLKNLTVNLVPLEESNLLSMEQMLQLSIPSKILSNSNNDFKEIINHPCVVLIKKLTPQEIVFWTSKKKRKSINPNDRKLRTSLNKSRLKRKSSKNFSRSLSPWKMRIAPKKSVSRNSFLQCESFKPYDCSTPVRSKNNSLERESNSSKFIVVEEMNSTFSKISPNDQIETLTCNVSEKISERATIVNKTLTKLSSSTDTSKEVGIIINDERNSGTKNSTALPADESALSNLKDLTYEIDNDQENATYEVQNTELPRNSNEETLCLSNIFNSSRKSSNYKKLNAKWANVNSPHKNRSEFLPGNKNTNSSPMHMKVSVQEKRLGSSLNYRSSMPGVSRSLLKNKQKTTLNKFNKKKGKQKATENFCSEITNYRWSSINKGELKQILKRKAVVNDSTLDLDLENTSPPWRNSTFEIETLTKNENQHLDLENDALGGTCIENNEGISSSNKILENTYENNNRDPSVICISSEDCSISESRSENSNSELNIEITESSQRFNKDVKNMSTPKSMFKSKDKTKPKNRKVTFSNMSVIIISDSDVSMDISERKVSGTPVPTNFSENNSLLQDYNKQRIVGTTPQNSAKSGKTTNATKINSINTPKRTKMPNFALLHTKMYDNMVDIKQYSEQKRERAKTLLSGHKPKQNDSTLLPAKKHSHKESSPKSHIKKKLKFLEQSHNKIVKSSSPKAKINNLNGYTRFGFKKFNKNDLRKDDQLKAIANKNRPPPKAFTVQQQRTAIQGFRSNRRFELLMKMRQKT